MSLFFADNIIKVDYTIICLLSIFIVLFVLHQALMDAPQW